jgi:hypothetical protein
LTIQSLRASFVREKLDLSTQEDTMSRVLLFAALSFSFSTGHAATPYSDCITQRFPAFKNQDPIIIHPDSGAGSSGEYLIIKRSGSKELLFKCEIKGGMGPDQFSTFDLIGGRLIQISSPAEFAGYYDPTVAKQGFGTADFHRKAPTYGSSGSVIGGSPYKTSCVATRFEDLRTVQDRFGKLLQDLGEPETTQIALITERKSAAFRKSQSQERSLLASNEWLIKKMMEDESAESRAESWAALNATLKWAEKYPDAPYAAELKAKIINKMKMGRGQVPPPVAMQAEVDFWTAFFDFVNPTESDAEKAARLKREETEESASYLKALREEVRTRLAGYEEKKAEYKRIIEAPIPENLKLSGSSMRKLNICAKAPALTRMVKAIYDGFESGGVPPGYDGGETPSTN